MKQFTRLNFYKGLFTSAEDWQAEQAYHIEKRKLHLRGLHQPGIVPGEGNELRVESFPGYCMVQPGYAVDSEGHDLYLTQPQKVFPPSKTHKGFSYIYIAYGERQVPESQRTYENYSGYSFVCEEPKLTWETEQNTDGLKIELARFEHLDSQTSKPIFAHRPYVRARLRGAFHHVQTEEFHLAANESRDWAFDEFDQVEEAADAFHLINVFPLPAGDQSARVEWRVASGVDQRKVRYRIYVKNQTNQETRVRCIIQRLNLRALL